MSGRSLASGSMRSAAGSVRLGAAAGAAAASSNHHELVLDALYERKRDNKSVRVLTVIIYVFCVSLAAIMLSLYYVFFWEPKDAHYAQRKVAHTVHQQQTSTTPMPTCFMPHTGRSNTTVSDETTAPTPTNFSSLPDDGSGPPDYEPSPTEPPTPSQTPEATDAIGTATTATDGVNAT